MVVQDATCLSCVPCPRLAGRVYVANVDGSPSASNSDPESFERTEPSRPSDAERELNELRARAYGPEPDIEADPAAIARLIELEAAHVAAATPVNVTASVDSPAADATPAAPPARNSVSTSPAAQKAESMIPTTSRGGRSLWQRATLTLSREWFVIGTIVVAAILGSAAWLLAPHPNATQQPTDGAAPHPDATLEPTELESDGFIEMLIAEAEDPDLATLRRFESYHDIDVWSVRVSSVENGVGTCLIALDRMGSGRFQYECLPTGLELILHMSVVAEDEFGFGDWLPDDSVISLHLRENRVDVFVHSPPAAT
jgi:hypothetical protein